MVWCVYCLMNVLRTHMLISDAAFESLNKYSRSELALALFRVLRYNSINEIMAFADVSHEDACKLYDMCVDLETGVKERLLNV